MGHMKKPNDDIWVDSAYVGNPWEAKPHERPVPDQLRKPFWRKPRVWITALALLAAIIACMIYSVVTPPMSKLNLRMMFKNYTVTVQHQKIGSHGGATGSTKLKINGNVIVKDTGNRNYVYYEMEDGTLYKYVQKDTGWEKEESSDHLLGNHLNVDMPSREILDKLFDAHNYEPSRWEPYVWNLKEDVDVGNVEGVRLERKDGHFMLSWGQNGYKFSAVFSGFLLTYFHTPPELFFKIIFE